LENIKLTEEESEIAFAEDDDSAPAEEVATSDEKPLIEVDAPTEEATSKETGSEGPATVEEAISEDNADAAADRGGGNDQAEEGS
jgi:hypothetical protein